MGYKNNPLTGKMDRVGGKADIVTYRDESLTAFLDGKITTIDLGAGNTIDLPTGEDFAKTCGASQAFTIVNPILKKPFRMVLTGGSLATLIFTGYTEYWVKDGSKDDYDNSITNYLWCEIREAGKVYLFWGV